MSGTTETPEGMAKRFALEVQTVRNHIHEYFTSVHGKDYVYRAPETFDNALERWMLAVRSGNLEVAAEHMARIQLLAAEQAQIEAEVAEHQKAFEEKSWEYE